MDKIQSAETPVIALVTAGGNGVRMHADRPKQFIEVCGRPVIIHTLLTLQAHPDISAVYVVCDPSWEAFVKEEAAKAGVSKLKGCFPAGRSGVDSIRHGVIGLKAACKHPRTLLLVHESVRPLLSAKALSNNILTARRNGSAVTCVQSNEAYLYSTDGLTAEEKVAREVLYRVQMPQTFDLDFLFNLFARATESDLLEAQSLFTFVKAMEPDFRFHLAQGEMTNFKITHPEDLHTLEALLSFSARS